MLDFETSNYKCEVSKSNSWEITSFSRTKSLQRVQFLTMCYTSNLSPLLLTKRFYANNYFEQQPIVSTAFKIVLQTEGFVFTGTTFPPLAVALKTCSSRRSLQCYLIHNFYLRNDKSFLMLPFSVVTHYVN